MCDDDSRSDDFWHAQELAEMRDDEWSDRVADLEERLAEARALLGRAMMADRKPIRFLGRALGAPCPEKCEHAACIPEFDEQAAQGLGAHEVRRRWPRFDGTCPDCGSHVAGYASFAHYLAGDW